MRSLLVGTLLLLPAIASAEVQVRQLKAPGTAAYGDIVAGAPTVNDLQFARQVLPPSGDTTISGTTALAQSKVIYLNKNGVTLQPGNNDSRTNRSTLATQATTIPAWTVSATTWTATVACMKELFAPFDVVVTETDPGTTTPHMEAVFGGSPTQLGMPSNVAGVSPFTTDCSVIENSIVFTFTNVIPADARLACEIMAQEVAHSYGLDHELLASDPMTYLDYTGNRTFKNQTASCGEDVTRPCGINGSTCRANQNSVALLTERLGAKSGDTVRHAELTGRAAEHGLDVWRLTGVGLGDHHVEAGEQILHAGDRGRPRGRADGPRLDRRGLRRERALVGASVVVARRERHAVLVEVDDLALRERRDARGSGAGEILTRELQVIDGRGAGEHVAVRGGAGGLELTHRDLRAGEGGEEEDAEASDQKTASHGE